MALLMHNRLLVHQHVLHAQQGATLAPVLQPAVHALLATTVPLTLLHAYNVMLALGR
jgi:hypothetical protein